MAGTASPGHQADHYITTVFPPPSRATCPSRTGKQGWPAGAKFLEKNFALEKGRIVHGRVIDAGTKRPIAGAAVVYQPKRENPNNSGDYDLRNPVVTDAEGRFAITALPGQGFLAVETTDENYMRVAVEDGRARRSRLPQGVAPIDVPKDGEPPPAEIVVRKGVTLQVRVIGPDGKPVAGDRRVLRGDRRQADGRLEPGAARSPTASSGCPGPIPRGPIASTSSTPSGSSAPSSTSSPIPRAGEPVEVRLQPTAKVHGKVVTASGSPVPGGQVNPADRDPTTRTGR